MTAFIQSHHHTMQPSVSHSRYQALEPTDPTRNASNPRNRVDQLTGGNHEFFTQNQARISDCENIGLPRVKNGCFSGIAATMSAFHVWRSCAPQQHMEHPENQAAMKKGLFNRASKTMLLTFALCASSIGLSAETTRILVGGSDDSPSVLEQPGLRVESSLNELGVLILSCESEAVPATLDWLKSLNRFSQLEVDQVLSLCRTPNDALYADQWSLGANATSELPSLWESQTGSHEIVVALVDSGADITHSDLRNNLWIHPAEIPGNGVDDDRNGFIDDFHGADMLTQSGNPHDESGHGTHLAGIIGAVGNNGLGTSGINWNISMLPVKAFNSQGKGLLSDVLKAYDYLLSLKKHQGIPLRLINNSFGSTQSSALLNQALAALAQEDLLLVFAAGDNGINLDQGGFYPAADGSALGITVTAHDHTQALIKQSNYGAQSMSAPGANILSTLPNENYGYMSGSSTAAAHATGVAALLMSVDPLAPTAVIRQVMETSASGASRSLHLSTALNTLNAWSLESKQSDLASNLRAYVSHSQLSLDSPEARATALAALPTGGLPTGATFDPETRTFSWTPTVGQIGDHQVTFWVTDGIDTDSETITISVTHWLSAPGNVSATWIGSGRARISWTDVSGEDGYHVSYYNGTNWVFAGTVAANQTQYDVNLPGNGSYSFVVQSYSGATKVNSAVVSLAPNSNLLTPAGNVSATWVGSGRVRVTWTDGANEERYDLYAKLGSANWKWVGNAAANATEATVNIGGNEACQILVRSIRGSEQQNAPTVNLAANELSAPGNVSATWVGSGRARVSWTDVSGEEGYHVSYYNGTNWVFAGTVTANQTQYDVNLPGNGSYSFVVQSYSGATKVNSAVVSLAPNTNVLTPADNVSATWVASGRVRVTWTDGANEERYDLYAKLGSANWKWVGNAAANATEATVNIGGNEACQILVRSIRGSEQQNAPTVNLAANGLSAPGNVSATWVASGRVRVTWTDGANEERYDLYAKLGSTNWKWVGNAAANATEATVNIGGNEACQILVRSIRGSEQQNAPTVNLAANGLSAPGNVSATWIGSAQVRVNWTDVSEEEGYHVFFYNGSNWVFAGTVAANQTQYNVSLAGNGSHGFVVQAFLGATKMNSAVFNLESNTNP
jgi:hypothetical protein